MPIPSYAHPYFKVNKINLVHHFNSCPKWAFCDIASPMMNLHSNLVRTQGLLLLLLLVVFKESISYVLIYTIYLFLIIILKWEAFVCFNIFYSLEI